MARALVRGIHARTVKAIAQPRAAKAAAASVSAPAGCELLRFITCGSVDDGKSTLIGRILWECGQIHRDQYLAIAQESRRYGTQGKAVDLALLVDGLTAEREQGITIDVAYRYFSTPARSFIVADTPGHEQYTRNMVTGASTAAVALLLVDAAKGLQTQTRRHAFLASLIGIRHVALAVNKMDLVRYGQGRFNRIRDELAEFAAALNLESLVTIPVSALKGDNVTTPSAHMPWFRGPTLLGYLESVRPATPVRRGLVFPVQRVTRPDAVFRGLAGTVAEGSVRPGDEVRVMKSGVIARIARIVTYEGDLKQARSGAAVTLVLDREVDASRGDVVAAAIAPVETSDQFEATLVWLAAEPGLIGRTYDLKLGTDWSAASITTLKYRIDVNTQAHEAATRLGLNDICVATLSTAMPVVFAPYEESRRMGAFILVDRTSCATVAAGMIRHSLRRAQNVHRQALSIGRAEREKLNTHPGKVIWFTGLSGAGKSTLANALSVHLHERGLRTYVLDGDNIRQGLNRDLGFTDADRVENIRRVAEVARLMFDAGLVVITAFISPFRQEREMARQLIGEENFVEVFVNTPLEVCEERDPKGLYRQARAGQLPNLTGVGSPYEAPASPALEITVGDSVVSSVKRIAERLAR